MDAQKRELFKLLKLLDDNGYSKHLILIGSWAEYMYMATGILPDYEAQIRTLDIDFLIKNLKRPIPPVNITTLAKEEGFYVEEDRLSGVTKLLSRKGIEVEFLIAQKGKGEVTSFKTNLGVTAQALRHLDLLKNHTTATHYLGISVTIPLPEAFVLHKIIINGQRKEKIEKDQSVINRMYKHLNLQTFHDLHDSLTKKEAKIVDQYLTDVIFPMLKNEETVAEARQRLK